MAKIRNRCLVLSIIKTIQPCTMRQVHEYIETSEGELTFKQVSSAFYQLISDDEIVHFKDGETILTNNKPEPIFKIREPGDVSLRIFKKTERKPPVTSNVHRLRAPMKYDENQKRIVIRFRDDKLKLLSKLKRYVKTERERDLLTGIINDYQAS